MSKPNTSGLDADRRLIREFGGPTKLARHLGLQGPGSVQRVQNWTARGIPAAIKVAYPETFLSGRGAPRKKKAA